MAKLLSILVVNAVFLLLCIVLVYASTEQNSDVVVAAISPSCKYHPEVILLLIFSNPVWLNILCLLQ